MDFMLTQWHAVCHPVFSQKTDYVEVKHSVLPLTASHCQFFNYNFNMYCWHAVIYNSNLLDERCMNRYVGENEIRHCSAAQSLRAMGCVWQKVKMAKERATHMRFSATSCTIKYVFYICEKIGEKYHFTISNISAECTILEDRDGTDSSFWLSNEQKVVLSRRMSLMISSSPFLLQNHRVGLPLLFILYYLTGNGYIFLNHLIPQIAFLIYF